MNTLHVRQVPADVYDALKQRAREHETSISSETIRLLRCGLALDSAGLRDLLDEVEVARPRPRAGRALTAAALIRRDRESR